MVIYKITLRPGTDCVLVDGEPVGPHLAVRRSGGRLWAIDHIPTGLRVTTAHSRCAAMVVARSISGAADWDFSDPVDAVPRTSVSLRAYCSRAKRKAHYVRPYAGGRYAE